MDAVIKTTNAIAIIGEPSIDRDLVWEGLQMPGSGVPVINGRLLLQGHMALAGLGDRVAALISVETAYHDGLRIGVVNARLQRDLNNQRLAQICDDTELTPCINMNPAHSGALHAKTKSATTEAMIGAAYLSGGLAMAERVMRKLEIID